MRPERDNLLMRTAFLWAERSTCSRNHVGAVFSRDGRVLVQGYNGAPAGMPHCDHSCDCRDPFGLSRPGPHEPNCNSLLSCSISVHAEANGIAFAARHGVSLEGASLHTTLSPCYNCAMLIINAGITEVYYDEVYRIPASLHLLREAGVKAYLFALPSVKI